MSGCNNCRARNLRSSPRSVGPAANSTWASIVRGVGVIAQVRNQGKAGGTTRKTDRLSRRYIDINGNGMVFTGSAIRRWRILLKHPHFARRQYGTHRPKFSWIPGWRTFGFPGVCWRSLRD
jgi:hypothetical protein